MTEDEMNEQQRRGEYVPPMVDALVHASMGKDFRRKYTVGADVVEVAARHIHAFLYGYEGANPNSDPDDEDRHIAGIVLAAVAPLLQAQAREDALGEAAFLAEQRGEEYREPVQSDYDRRDGCYAAAAAIRALKGPQT